MKKVYRPYAPKGAAVSVLFKMTEAEHERINVMFRASLQNIIDGNFNHVDWCNVTFRVKIALILAIERFDDITIHSLKKCYDICEEIAERSGKFERVVWYASTDEIEWLTEALKVTEELQRVVDRKSFREAGRVANDYIRIKYVYGTRFNIQMDL